MLISIGLEAVVIADKIIKILRIKLSFALKTKKTR